MDDSAFSRDKILELNNKEETNFNLKKNAIWETKSFYISLSFLLIIILLLIVISIYCCLIKYNEKKTLITILRYK